MTETIESFVNKLQNEGVQAGRQQADKLITDAQDQAKKVKTDAEAQAKKIIADAEAQAQSIVQRGQTELKLAARDAMLKLGDSIANTIDSATRRAAQEKISDPDFIASVLRELITLSAQGKDLSVSVSSEMKDKIASWEISQLANVDLKAELKTAGFEYTTESGTVEVTLDAVMEVLDDLVGAKMREVISGAKEQ